MSACHSHDLEIWIKFQIFSSVLSLKSFSIAHSKTRSGPNSNQQKLELCSIFQSSLCETTGITIASSFQHTTVSSQHTVYLCLCLISYLDNQIILVKTKWYCLRIILAYASSHHSVATFSLFLNKYGRIRSNCSTYPEASNMAAYDQIVLPIQKLYQLFLCMHTILFHTHKFIMLYIFSDHLNCQNF